MITWFIRFWMTCFTNLLYRFLRWFYTDPSGYNLILTSPQGGKLYLGNIMSSTRLTLNKLRIQVVVNATKDAPFESSMTKNYRVPVDDDLAMSSIIDMVKYMNIMVPIIHSHLIQGHNVLVHCRAGIQRSAAIIAAYLILYYNMSVNQAIEYVRKQRQIAFRPSANFLHSLELIDSTRILQPVPPIQK